MLCGVAGSPALATVVPGCAAPVLASTAHTFYVDPVNGSMTGDGSRAHPWHTLAEVVDPANGLIQTWWSPDYAKGDQTLQLRNPNGPVHAGDRIELMTGDHGAVSIAGAVNTAFITVTAAEGQVPVLDQLYVTGAAGWQFEGLTVQGLAPVPNADPAWTSTYLVRFDGTSWLGPTNNIVFARNTVQAAADSSGWTPADWLNKPTYYGLISEAACTSVTNNQFQNLFNAMGLLADGSQAIRNTIQLFFNDGIDFAGSNMQILSNAISGNQNSSLDIYHSDGIQGWSLPGVTNTNVRIDGNSMLKTGSGAVSYMQGISIFDGRWDHLVVSNNVVVTDTWNGIALHGIDHAAIVNNTVMPSDPTTHQTMIDIEDAKDGTPSTHVVVRNNLTYALLVLSTDRTVVVDHNFITWGRLTLPVAGKLQYDTKPGTYGTANQILAAGVQLFTNYDPLSGAYDLTLAAGSPATGLGNNALAPARDILQRLRSTPVDLGAFRH